MSIFFLGPLGRILSPIYLQVHDDGQIKTLFGHLGAAERSWLFRLANMLENVFSTSSGYKATDLYFQQANSRSNIHSPFSSIYDLHQL